MSVRSELGKRIEKERQQISELKGQLEKAEAFVQGLQEALKMLPREPLGDGSVAATILRTGSDVFKVRELLQKDGRPMHVREILLGINKPDTKANRASISGSLSNYARREEIFKRTGPNTFGLIGMAVNDWVNEEPPPEFGGKEIGEKVS